MKPCRQLSESFSNGSDSIWRQTTEARPQFRQFYLYSCNGARACDRTNKFGLVRSKIAKRTARSGQLAPQCTRLPLVLTEQASKSANRKYASRDCAYLLEAEVKLGGHDAYNGLGRSSLCEPVYIQCGSGAQSIWGLASTNTPTKRRSRRAQPVAAVSFEHRLCNDHWLQAAAAPVAAYRSKARGTRSTFSYYNLEEAYFFKQTGYANEIPSSMQ